MPRKLCCIHFSVEEDIDGQGACLLWDDDPPVACIGWLSEEWSCIDYEAFEYITLEKLN